MTTQSGVLYVATNKERYIEEAIRSAQSVRQRSPQLPIALVTDNPTYATARGKMVIDEIIDMQSAVTGQHDSMIDKIRGFSRTPFQRTLFLDTDTYVLCNCTDLLDLLRRFQVVITHSHNRRAKEYKTRNEGSLFGDKALEPMVTSAIPESFAPIQGGFLLYKYEDGAVRDWIAALEEHYRLYRSSDDQVVMRRTLWDSNLSLYALPEEYNFNDADDVRYWKKGGFRKAVPKIFHYTRDKENPSLAIRWISKHEDAPHERRRMSRLKTASKRIRQLLRRTP